MVIFSQAFCPGPMVYDKAFCSLRNILLLDQLCLSVLHLVLSPEVSSIRPALAESTRAWQVLRLPYGTAWPFIFGECRESCELIPHCAGTTESTVPWAVLATNQRLKGCTACTSSASAAKSKRPLVSHTSKLHHFVLLLVTTKFGRKLYKWLVRQKLFILGL